MGMEPSNTSTLKRVRLVLLAGCFLAYLSFHRQLRGGTFSLIPRYKENVERVLGRIKDAVDIFDSGIDFTNVQSEIKAYNSPRGLNQPVFKSPEDLGLNYKWHNGTHLLVGKKFNISTEYLKSIGVPFTKNFTVLTKDNVKDFIFVTASSQNHFVESIDAIARIQKYMPNYKIIYYDLGLANKSILRINSWCNVIYKKFNYSHYPELVRRLSATYSFKAMIVKEVLQEYPALLWMDSSFRLQTGKLQPVFDLVLTSGGALQFYQSPHSMWAATYPAMWKYLVSDELMLQQTWMHGANSMLLYKTEKVYFHILHWWILCALDTQCITPNGSNKKCPKLPDMKTYHYKTCHRQDQSSFGTLIANMNDFDSTRYVPKDPLQYVKLIKTGMKREFVNGKVCPTSHSSRPSH